MALLLLLNERLDVSFPLMAGVGTGRYWKQYLKPRTGTFRVTAKSTYQISTFYKQIKRGDWRRTNSWEIYLKPAFSRLWGSAKRLKSWNHQNYTPIEPLLNLHAKFQPPSSIWRGYMRETNLKNKKTRPKTHFFSATRRCKEAEKLKPSNRRLQDLYMPNFNLLP